MRFSWILIVPLVGMLSSCLKDNAPVDQTGPQYIKDTAAIASYIKQNGISATKLPQGVWFIIDSGSAGIRATFNDSVKLTYTKRLLVDNSVVDHSATPKHFVLDSLMLGVQDALPQFPAGSKGRIFIPSFYTNGFGVLYSTSSVVFEFKLFDVKDYRLKLDTATIDSYLNLNSIKAEKDNSGLRYTIDTLKAGDTPKMTDEVQVNYLARDLSDGAILGTGTSISFSVSSLILGWQIGLQKIQEGSTCTFYLPSSLGYGPSGNGATIKANTNLIFTVKLLKVIHH
jgi:FKBP-type peptidyl-prolyl cis-trans isomerase FkpA